MKKALTDTVFVLSLLGFVWTYVHDQLQPLVNAHTYSVLAVIFAVIAASTYFLYEALTGTISIPTITTTSAVVPATPVAVAPSAPAVTVATLPTNIT